MANVAKRLEEPDDEVIREILRYIADLSRVYKVDPRIIAGIVQQESRFDAESYRYNYDDPKDRTYGLMHLSPITASWILKRDVTEEELLEPIFNIYVGIMLFKYLLRKFNGNVNDAVAAFNAGEGSVMRWKTSYGGNRYGNVSYINAVYTNVKTLNRSYGI